MNPFHMPMRRYFIVAVPKDGNPLYAKTVLGTSPVQAIQVAQAEYRLATHRPSKEEGGEDYLTVVAVLRGRDDEETERIHVEWRQAKRSFEKP